MAADALTHERRMLDTTDSRPGDVPIRTVQVRSTTSVTVGTAFPLGTLTCTLFSSEGAVEVVGTRERTMTGITLGMVLEGESIVRQAGRSVVLHQGQFAFYAAAQPFVLGAPGPHRYLTVTIPLFSFGLPLIELSDIFATEVSGASPSVSMLSTALTTVVTAPEGLSAPARTHCGTAILALVRAVISDHGGATASKRMNLFNQLARWLEERLSEGQVDAERLATEHHLSVRYVRQIFAEHGTTVTRFVRERRLEQVRADLLDPARAVQSIASIARQWRFDDPSVFSRAFRAQYGQTPREYRLANAQQ
jgi:AraC-like DNA-binding protein